MKKNNQSSEKLEKMFERVMGQKKSEDAKLKDKWKKTEDLELNYLEDISVDMHFTIKGIYTEVSFFTNQQDMTKDIETVVTKLTSDLKAKPCKD